MDNIPFIDLNSQRERIAEKIDAAVLRVVHEGKYIMGPEVQQLEKELQVFTGAKHCITCSNGTDALAFILMAKGIKAGDAIFVPDFTFIATAEVVAWMGATPFFVDVLEDSFNLDPASLRLAVEDAKKQGLNPAGIIAVDLFGQPADYPAIIDIADSSNMWVMSDNAQGFGSSLHGKKSGKWGLVTATSFFPAKPLGCYGDGGAIFTDDDELADIAKSIRVHGKGSDKYDNVRVGLNARLDTIQAAVLLEKLKIFPDELLARQSVADRYNQALSDVVKTPNLIEGATSAWAQYTLVLPDGVDRNKFASYCQKENVPTAVYYPIPLSQQAAYKHYPTVSGGTPVSRKISKAVISLPMHPYLEIKTQDYIVEVVKQAIARD